MRTKNNSKLKRTVIIRVVCNVIAFIFLILAYSGLSWGEYLSPVQKSGTAVSFVFDISNSMLAKDCPGDNTRLESACIFARKIMERVEGISISVVLTKGDGVVAVPLTEDYSLIDSLLEVMSPNLMTVPGTSLGKGILVAKKSFPQNYSRAGRIFVFTDGEETDGELITSLEECIKNGIPVSLIGFGAEKETDILLPDGKTTVKTALRSENIKKTIETVIGKNKHLKLYGDLIYVDSNEKGSASRLLSQLENDETKSDKILSYETKPIQRYKLFLFLAILFFIAGYVITEFNYSLFTGKAKKITPVLMCFIFMSCNTNTLDILQGTMNWHKKEYKKSVASFKHVLVNKENPQEIKDYALYNLGSSYTMLNEEEAAIEQFNKISADAPKNVKYGAYYNMGVILFENGKYEDAKDCFKKAIQTDNSKLDAKINMELSMQMVESNIKKSQATANPAVDNQNKQPEVEDALFEHIKENDQKQWKNSESDQNTDYSNDY